MRSWTFLSFDRILIPAVVSLLVASCSDDAQSPIVDLANQGASAQHGWQWSNPQPQGNHLHDVSFYDENIGFAVGGKGAIVRSTDGGQTWALQTSGTTEMLRGVATVGPMNTLAVGPHGTMLRTTNRGVTWKQVQTGETAHLADIDFADAQHGIAVGDRVTLASSDGGATWASFDCECGMQRVDLVDPRTAFAVSGVNIYKTSDGGATWDSLATAPNLLNGVSFSDANAGTVVGWNGTIMRTTDGGVSWSVQSSGITANLTSVHFADASHGMAVADGSFPATPLLRTSDGGAHWVHDPWTIEAPPAFYGVAMLDAETGVAVGLAGNILRTTDGGASWVNETQVSAGFLWGVAFADEDNGLAVGLPHLLRTTDGGASWQRQTMGDTRDLHDAAYCGPRTVVAVGNDRESGLQGGVILRSTDGGANWETNHPQTRPLVAVDFSDGCVGVAVGGEGTILRTTDGGASWVLQEKQTVEDLNDVSMLDENIGIVVGRNDTILRTIDGGVSWNYQPHELIHEDLLAVDFADSDVGITVSTHHILRTGDGGLTWFEQPSGVDAQYWGVVCKDRDSAAMLGSIRFRGQVVLVTTDGGAHWSIHDVIAEERLFDITITGKKTVTAVGRWGTIIQARDLFRPNV